MKYSDIGVGGGDFYGCTGWYVIDYFHSVTKKNNTDLFYKGLIFQWVQDIADVYHLLRLFLVRIVVWGPTMCIDQSETLEETTLLSSFNSLSADAFTVCITFKSIFVFKKLL